jgi:hypothetical protein
MKSALLALSATLLAGCFAAADQDDSCKLKPSQEVYFLMDRSSDCTSDQFNYQRSTALKGKMTCA